MAKKAAVSFVILLFNLYLMFLSFVWHDDCKGVGRKFSRGRGDNGKKDRKLAKIPKNCII